MTLQETLKQATQKNHDELEKLMYVHQIMDGSLSVKRYQGILVTNFLVHREMESFLHDHLSGLISAKLNVKSRCKSSALEADLREVRLSVPANNHNCGVSAFFDNDAKILGALYVLEGATLGGSVIVKKLKNNLNFAPLNLNFNYYQVYGLQLVPKWKQFIEVLNEQPVDAYADSVAGAIEVFNYIAEIQKANSAVFN